jgi:hypothetical protein
MKIKHRVRDEVAFGVALRLRLSCGKQLWLIPTSGLQAYPFAFKPLAPIAGEMTQCGDFARVPDHYSHRERKGQGADLLHDYGSSVGPTGGA